MGFTKVERTLADGGFGQAVIDGLNGADVRQARKVQAEMRSRAGYSKSPRAILTPGAAQNKLGKNKLASFGMMLTPQLGIMSIGLQWLRTLFGLKGAWNICPLASDGCAAACLVHSGQSGMPAAQFAQAVRTMFLLAYPRESGLIIGAEIRAALKKHGRINLRLNTTSDIRWELISPNMIRALAEAGVQLYDYTAWSPEKRCESDDYRLTYSAKETAHTSDEYLRRILAGGGNVAVPFDTKRGMPLPATFLGYPVIDGDLSDERRNDPRGVVVGLRAKGYRWRRDNSAGFIRLAANA